MVTARRVFWTSTARRDLQQIYQRVAQRSPETAQALVEGMLKVIEELNTQHANGTPEPLLARETMPYLYIKYAFYKIVYSLIDDKVVIKLIYHQRQDPTVG
ncbi:type II toxin-antitoxin system RelE/ParE family toxin [Eisenibacter elegans]|jgi:plasmid stabilization system protein ParE|uniref:type II toxin-antitoxin system RelE/ParE family toxin n=1 Tax=Eisenibacter elegans TaxID=997 RepID=UPI00041C87D6|nr:type II toxin-antitoxin system RelE/ParE family toxin [Eisenibacter elegans]